MKKAYRYENVQIGNFLISFGYYLKDFNVPLIGIINLFQQTPKDYEVGDVFGGLQGRYFILEFKNDSTQIKEENNKNQRVKLIANLMSNQTYMDISLRCHLIGYPTYDQNKELLYNFEPYFTAFTCTKDLRFENFKSAKHFVGRLLYGDNSLGCSSDEMKAYVKLLHKCANSSDDGAMSGVVICIDKEKGLSSNLYDDIWSLSKTMGVDDDNIPDINSKLSKDLLNKKLDKPKGMGM